MCLHHTYSQFCVLKFLFIDCFLGEESQAETDTSKEVSTVGSSQERERESKEKETAVFFDW